MKARCAGSCIGSLWLVLVVVALALALTAPPARAADPAQGPGGPILVVTSNASTYGTYYAEILRTEGFNAFQVADIGAVTSTMLAAYDIVVLAKMTLTSSQVSMLGNWVTGGGNLIAMAPDAQLAGLLGLTAGGTPLAEGYLLVDTTSAPGNGIVGQTMQFHGSANRWTLNGATSIATLYSSSSTATSSPAVSLRYAGSGRAAAFAYDLATSIVYTRHGNPAWAAQERDAYAPIRSDDKFYGAKQGDVQKDWVDLSKVSIPQADEQQRLLANLIVTMNDSRKPLPRFWYFPNGKKAVVIMTGDDHGNGGTAGRFDQFKTLSPSNCSVANWECVRGTSYIYSSTPLTDAQAAQYTADGFEVGLHVNTGCSDFTASSLQGTYDQQVPEWLARFPSAGPPRTQRHHCIVWSDWSSGAQVQLSKGMRLDTSYYFWPPSWVADVPGMFTGSAMPMRFTKPDGGLIDVYMAATQMTDESGQTYPKTVDTLLDRAVGAEGYYGAYTVNAHTDSAQSDVADAVVASARARGVPIISANQMLAWLDGRNASSFGAIAFDGSTLAFTVTKEASANGLQGMLPLRSGGAQLLGLSRNGATLPFSVVTVKGLDYAFFAADSGSYAATYGVDSSAPVVISQTPAPGSSGVDIGAAIRATFSEALLPSSVSGSTFELRDAANTLVSAGVSYDSASRTATLKPAAALAGTTTYTVTLRGGTADPRIKDVSGNALAANVTWTFTTAAAPPPPACPCSAWSASTTPTTPQASDSNAVELGVRFTTTIDGFITGVRFYKGTGNTGVHVGNLWSASGALLARATFSAETASGWQQVNFASPVAVTANTVYVASYYAPAGNYAADANFFAASGVSNGPVTLLSNAAAGGNGVYRYASTTTFPSSTYNATNYWVDIVFSYTSTTPADTTPPTVSNVSPAAGATSVATTTSVSATFSEPMDAATIGASTFELRDAANALVAASVSYDATTMTARLTPAAALAAAQTYTARVRGGSTDPRVKDATGNALAADQTWSFTTAAAGGGGGGTGGCSAPPNPIVAENCLAGSPASEWDITGSGDPSIQGFATDISVNRGATVSFKVSTNATAYRFDIYRMGYYAGLGARKVASVNPSAGLPQNQPNCLNDAGTGLIDCGNWAVSGSWTVPATATSGIYFAKLVRADTGGSSHIVFIVRDDASTAPLLFQTSDTTWQAYNDYGGNSLYTGSPDGRAYKVSYNRPFRTRSVDNGQDWLFNAEYPMVRWLESNGYDVAYISGLDSHRAGALLRNHRVFLSVGHDEYWSGGQRANVTAARDAGVHLAFFSGNEVFWKTRWEPSIDASKTANRTLVCYKETHANAKIDPSPEWTGTWRDPRFSPPSDGGRPENELTGTIFMANDTGTPYSISVPAADGKMRFWRNTSVASLAAGQSATLPVGTLGYEWDSELDNGARPPGLWRLSTTSITMNGALLDYGSTFGNGTVTHYLTQYRAPSGALVFGAGTIQWAWGLDATHDRGNTAADVRMQQATVNLFADMGVQPATLGPGLVAASASTDITPPASTIASPTAGSTLAVGTPVTISGSASDSGGVVGGVEVSVDGGTRWHPAVGRGAWSYDWTPTSNGTFTIRTRAVDDSGNLEAPGAGTTITAGSGGAPDTTAPTISAVSPAADATGVARSARPSVTFSEAIDPATVNSTTYELRNATTNALVAGTVSYDAATRRAILDPSGNLATRTRYTATVRGGATDPRIKDLAGNPLAASLTWSFTTR